MPKSLPPTNYSTVTLKIDMQVRVEVTLDEQATVVDHFRDRTGESYSSKYRARYELKQVHGKWLITRGTVIPGK